MTRFLTLGFLFTAMSLSVTAGAALTSDSTPLQDVYKYQIEGGFPLRESCTVDGQEALSLIKVYVDPTQAATFSLADAYVKIRVCTVFGKQVKQSLPLVLPVQALAENLKAKTGTTLAFPFLPSRLSAHFPNGTGPDTALLKRIQGPDRELAWFELTLVQSRTNTVKVGPVRLGMAIPASLTSIPGFNSSSSVPLKKLEVDVPENNITLRAELRRLEQEVN